MSVRGSWNNEPVRDSRRCLPMPNGEADGRICAVDRRKEQVAGACGSLERPSILRRPQTGAPNAASFRYRAEHTVG